ncbi:hypothetical protein BH10ACT7_BH10ACT7_32870 [soil metagenome]
MGMATKASVTIDAPREEVFRWLVEPEKLTIWMGSAGAMPADPSQLKVGFTAQGTMPAPGGTRPNTLTVTAWDPPSTFGCTITYEGGDSVSMYTLATAGSGTRLELSGDTDWAQADLSQLDTALAGQDPAAQAVGRGMINGLMRLFRSGAWDGPTRKLMQKSVEDSLAKLKGLVEAG